MSPNILIPCTSGTLNCESTLAISNIGGKVLNLLVRQVEPAYYEIVFCEHGEATEEPTEALLQLMLTRADITLCIAHSRYTCRYL